MAAHMKISMLTLGISILLLFTNYSLPDYVYYNKNCIHRAFGILLPTSLCCLVTSFITVYWAFLLPKKPSSRNLQKCAVFGCFIGGILEFAAFGIYRHCLDLYLYRRYKMNSSDSTEFLVQFTFPQTYLILSGVLAFLSGVVLACNLKKEPQQRTQTAESDPSMLTQNNQLQGYTLTFSAPNSTGNRMSSTGEIRESGIPSGTRTRDHTSALTDQNPPSYVEYMSEMSTIPYRWVTRSTKDTQTAIDNGMFFQAAVNMQPSSGAT